MAAANVFTKTAPANQPGQPFYEAAGLRWLGQGGAPVAQVVDVGEGFLKTTRVQEAGATPGAATKLGCALARMHASGAPHFGAAPPGYEGTGWMGMAALPLIAKDQTEPDQRQSDQTEPGHPTASQTVSNSPDSPATWGEFYANLRIRPYLEGTFTTRETATLIQLCRELERGSFDHPQPSLVREKGFTAARIHGDLWSGNVLWSADGAVLIDPAAQGGHAEEDLAALAVFGAPYLPQIVDGYQSVSTLAPGWENRVCLHQMHILVVHCHLFGRSYVPRTMACAEQTLEVLHE